MRTPRLALGLAALASAGLLAYVLFAEEPGEGRRYALVVGVQDYKGTDLGSLHYCDNDAAGLADVLTKRGYRVTLMTQPAWKAGDRDDLLPTADNIRDNLKAILRNRKPADTVLLAFSGHGEQLKRDGKMYFCAAKCDLDKPETLVSLDEVYALLKDNPAGGKVLIVDACRNDPLAGRTVGSEKLESVTRPELPDPPGGTVALFSCSKGEKAYESDALKHGYLFHFVIEGLEGKAAGKGGRIKWTDLTKHVDDELSDAVTAELGARAVQTPEVRGESHGLVLAQLDAAAGPPDGAALAGPDRKALIADLRAKVTTLSYKRAQLALSKLDLERGEALAASQGISKLELDRRRQTLKTDQAAVEDSLQAVYAVRASLGLPARPDKGDDLAEAPPEWEQDAGAGDKVEEFEYTVEGRTKKGTRRVRTLDLGGGVTMELVRIPHGTFTMGSPDSDKDADKDEKPQHEVTITKDFYLGKYPVTQEQYQALTGKNSSWYSASGSGRDKVAGLDTRRFPVDTVTWDDAKAFCLKLNGKANGKVGLPTEAEWEYACRAGTTTRFPCGDELTAADANCNDKLDRTCVVGSYPANPFGLYDMTGNVLEWCSDYYDPKYYSHSPKDDPENLTPVLGRVQRGDSFDSIPGYCRAANRAKDTPDDHRCYFGFRVRVRPE